MKASVNLQFPSFAPRHRLSKLISALGLASVATAARYESAACDGRNFSSSEERALALGLSPKRSLKFTCDFSASAAELNTKFN